MNFAWKRNYVMTEGFRKLKLSEKSKLPLNAQPKIKSKHNERRIPFQLHCGKIVSRPWLKITHGKSSVMYTSNLNESQATYRRSTEATTSFVIALGGGRGKKGGCNWRLHVPQQCIVRLWKIVTHSIYIRTMTFYYSDKGSNFGNRGSLLFFLLRSMIVVNSINIDKAISRISKC